MPFGSVATVLCCVEAPERILAFLLEVMVAGCSPMEVGVVSAGADAKLLWDELSWLLTSIVALVSTRSLLI